MTRPSGADAITFDPDEILRRRHASVRRPATWPFLVPAAILTFIVGALTADPAAIIKTGIPAEQRSDAFYFALGGAIANGAILGGIVWLVLYFAFVRRRNPGAGLAHYAILATIAFASHALVELAPAAGGTRPDPHQEELARQGIADSFRKVQSGLSVDARPTAQGEVGVMEGFVRANLNKRLELNKAFQAEINASGLATLFSEASLGPDPTLARTQRKLGEIADIVEKYRRLTLAQEDQMWVDAQHLPISETSRRQFITGMDNSKPATEAGIRQMWSDQTEIVAEYRAAAGLLKAARGRWGFEGGKIVFARPDDLNGFRRHQANVRRLLEDEKAVQARMTADSLHRLETKPAG